jgi:hypothetical protein
MDKERLTVLVLGGIALGAMAGSIFTNVSGWDNIISAVAGGLLGYLKSSKEE